MAYDLRAQPFSESLLADVRDFDCGDERWQVEVARWIKDASADDCAVTWMRRGTKVWLYRTDEGELVGYGSLGTTKWRVVRDAPRQSVSIIPGIAVQRRFQGEPKQVPPDERFAYRIVADLISKAACGVRGSSAFSSTSEMPGPLHSTTRSVFNPFPMKAEST